MEQGAGAKVVATRRSVEDADTFKRSDRPPPPIAAAALDKGFALDEDCPFEINLKKFGARTWNSACRRRRRSGRSSVLQKQTRSSGVAGSDWP